MSLSLPARYRHLRPLGRGGMGEVHLVWDAERGEELALKAYAPPQDRPEARAAFRQEFGAMASLAHPHLVRAHDFGQLADGRPFFTMECVGGEDLGRQGRQGVEAVAAWLPQVASALAFLHARGYVHGDLNPGNVRILGPGSAKLMDLGLLERSGRSGGPVRGTLAYLAPEVARSAAVDGRADLYALGAVLFECLSGQVPFPSEDPIALLKAHLQEAPPSLGALAPELPKAWVEAIARLLAKAPEERFPTAGALLAALGLEASLPEAQGLLAAPLVERTQVLAQIRTLWDGGGQNVWLQGAAGAGKSRLLAEARALAQLSGRPAFGIGAVGPQSAPYAAWRPALLGLWALAPEALQARWGPLWVKLLPELPYPPAEPLEGAQERTRLHQAVGELAEAVAPQAAWLLDAPEALDDASAALWASLRVRPDQPWAFVAASEGPPPEGEDWSLAQLEPLSGPGLAQVAAALLGQAEAPEALLEPLATLTGGLPGAVEAVLGHWVRTGLLQGGQGRWELKAEADFSLPGGWQAAQDARVDALPPQAQALAKVAALVGPSGPLEVALAAAELAPAEGFEASAALEAAELWAVEAGSFRFLRPSLATALASRWPQPEAQEVHGRLGAAHARRAGGAPEAPGGALGDRLAAARHLLAGPTPSEGLPWALAAVQSALSLYVLGGVEGLLQAALALPEMPPEVAKGLLVAQATWLRFQSQLEEALAIYEGLLDPEDPSHAHHLTSIGVILQMRERYPEALARLAEAIQVADARQDVVTGVRARNFVGRVAIFAGQPGVARTHLRSAVRRAREAELWGSLASSLSLYGYLLATKDPSPEALAEGVAALQEAIRLNERSGNDYEQQDAWSVLGNVYLHAGRLTEARDAIHQALAICRRLNMVNEILFGHLNLGACLLELGDLPGALAQASRAVALARKLKRRFPEGFSVALEGLVRLHRGELSAGLAALEQGLAIAKDIGNKYLELNVAPMLLEGYVHLGRLPQAEGLLRQARALAIATKNDEQNPKLDRLELAMAVLGLEGRAASLAEALLAEAERQGQAAPWAHALRWEAERLERAGQPEVALARVRQARDLAEASTLGLLSAELALHEGRLLLGEEPAEAAVAFAIAMDLADALGAPVPGAIARAGLAASDASMAALRSEARQRLEALTAALSPAEMQDFQLWPGRDLAFAAPRTLSGGFSIDRVRHLTELITAISASASLEDVLHQALAALVELAACERGFLLLYEGFEVTHRVYQGPQGDDHELHSATMAYQVLWSGHPIVLEDALSDAEFGVATSVQQLELRFAVGVPIRHGHETLGVMLADSKGLNPEFGSDDLVIAEALGKQVAVAIRQARELERYRNGYQELERLHQLSLKTLGEGRPERVLQELVGEAISMAEADRGVVLWGEALRPWAHFDAQGRPLPGDPEAVSRSVAQWVLDRQEPLHLQDAQADEAFQAAKSVAALGLRTIVALPLVHGGQALGVLYLDMERLGEPGEGVMHYLEALSRLLGAYLSRQAEVHPVG